VSKAIEVITSVERRRRWSAAEKERLVAASLEPSASVLAVAREAGIQPSQLYGWRRQLLRGSRPAASFAAVRIAAGPATAGLPAVGLIEVEFEWIAAADQRSSRCGHADHDDRDARERRTAAMISLPAGARVWLATGHTDMRKGFDGLALLVQETLKRNPHNGHLFVFRGRRGSLIKVLWHDGQGMCHRAGPDHLHLLRLKQARQARRGRDRAARGGVSAVESRAARAREVHAEQ